MVDKQTRQSLTFSQKRSVRYISTGQCRKIGTVNAALEQLAATGGSGDCELVVTSLLPIKNLSCNILTGLEEQELDALIPASELAIS